MQPINLPGSMAGTIIKSEQMRPDENKYQRLRRLDLEYAIKWNVLKGKTFPEIPKDSDKDTLVKFCEIYKVDLDLCEANVDHQNVVRISRPPVDVVLQEKKEEEKKEEKHPEEMNPFQLKKFLKDNGFEVPEGVTKKADLLEIMKK